MPPNLHPSKCNTLNTAPARRLWSDPFHLPSSISQVYIFQQLNEFN